jgi:cell fate (sporulation/competence/biofilm development) regulator YlbF (YheA/YmcA/DUF963 family)
MNYRREVFFMDVITAARALGRAMQADERFKSIIRAQAANDADKALQNEISAFNMKRAQLNAELQKQEKDTTLIKELDAEIKDMYAKIFENPNMKAYTLAKAGMNGMIDQVNKIIGDSAAGEDPDSIDPTAISCGGDCGGCAGCK